MKSLSNAAKTAIENPTNLKFVSIASLWEIAIKISLGKLRFSMSYKQFLELIVANGFYLLPISPDHTFEVSQLEFIHRAPFDRLLIAQCKSDKLSIVTKDENIRRYSVKTIW